MHKRVFVWPAMTRRFRAVLLAVLFLTAAYLFAWPSANVPYFAAVILHLVAGIVLLIFLVFGLRGILRSASAISRIGWILIAMGGVLGAVLIKTGTRRDEWPLLYTHIGTCVAGGAFLASAWASKRGFFALGGAAGVLRTAMFVVAAALAVSAAWWMRTVPWERAHRIENPAIAPGTMDSEGDGPGGPFFPSSAQTAHGGANSRELFYGVGFLPALPRGHLQGVAKLGASFFFVQQCVVSQEHRVHAGHSRRAAVEVVRGLPRSCATF